MGEKALNQCEDLFKEIRSKVIQLDSHLMASQFRLQDGQVLKFVKLLESKKIDLESAYDIKINFEQYDFLKHLDVPYTHSLYTIVKVLQTYIDYARESMASEVSIRFELNKNNLQIIVEDNGTNAQPKSLFYSEFKEVTSLKNIDTNLVSNKEGNRVTMEIPLAVF